MTRKQLEEYGDLRQEVQYLEQRLATMSQGRVMSDHVRGSDPEHPYTKQYIAVQGVGLTRRERLQITRIRKRLHERKARLIDEMAAVEAFLDTVTDSKTRRIIELKYLRGKSWNATATDVYGYPCGDRARMHMNIFFRKSF